MFCTLAIDIIGKDDSNVESNGLPSIGIINVHQTNIPAESEIVRAQVCTTDTVP